MSRIMNRIVIILAASAFLCGCARKPADQNPLVLSGFDESGPVQWPTTNDTTEVLIGHLTGPSPDKLGWAAARAMAIDILRDRKAEVAIPQLIECLGDTRALLGSDNWVGGHAANALSELTGRPFSIEQKEWKEWWSKQEKKN